MIAVACPACQEVKEVVRFGTNRSGTPRARCKACGKTFTLAPKSRALTTEKEAAIVRALQERTSQRGIARTLHVSRDTIRAVRKKSSPVRGEMGSGQACSCDSPRGRFYRNGRTVHSPDTCLLVMGCRLSPGRAGSRVCHWGPNGCHASYRLGRCATRISEQAHLQ
jgi:transposase-like protein